MADIWMDVNIALAEVPVNIMPLIDDTDFKSIEAAVLFNAAGMALKWHFVTTAGAMTETAVTPTSGGVHDWTDQGTSGLYALEIPASAGTINNDTEGFGWFSGVATGVLPWRGPIIGFRAAVINNALIDDSSMITSLDIGLLYESVITTSITESEYIMAIAVISDDAWNGLTCTITDISTGESVSRRIKDCIGSTETLIVNAAPPFLIEDGVDVVRVFRDEQASGANAAIQAKTDLLAFTSGNVDANVVKVAGGLDIKTSGTGGQEHGE